MQNGAKADDAQSNSRGDGDDGDQVADPTTTPEQGKVQTVVKRVLPHVLLLVAASLYTVGGGYAFYMMERNHRPVPGARDPPPNADVKPASSASRTLMRRDAPNPQCTQSLQYALVEASRRECVLLANDTGSLETHQRYCSTLLLRLLNCLKPFGGELEPLDYAFTASSSTTRSTTVTPSSASTTTTTTTTTSIPPTTQRRRGEFDSKLRSGEWTPSTCTFMAFTIISTIGYGDVAPVTVGGRLFCIIYGLFGIPLALLAVADQGRFLTAFVLFLYKKLKIFLSKCLRGKRPEEPPPNADLAPPGREEDDTMPALLLVGLFALYLVMGGCLFTRYESQWSFVDAVYFTFISSATIGFGDEIPANQTWLPFTLFYIAIGLALATAAIDICAEYLRRLHHFGAKIRNCANKLVWFGGKHLTIGEVIRAVGSQLGVAEEKIQHLVENFDQVVEQTIIEKEQSPPVKEAEPPAEPPEAFTVQIPFIDGACTSYRDASSRAHTNL